MDRTLTEDSEQAEGVSTKAPETPDGFPLNLTALEKLHSKVLYGLRNFVVDLELLFRKQSMQIPLPKTGRNQLYALNFIPLERLLPLKLVMNFISRAIIVISCMADFQLKSPYDVAVDSNNEILYVADTGNNR